MPVYTVVAILFIARRLLCSPAFNNQLKQKKGFTTITKTRDKDTHEQKKNGFSFGRIDHFYMKHIPHTHFSRISRLSSATFNSFGKFAEFRSDSSRFQIRRHFNTLAHSYAYSPFLIVITSSKSMIQTPHKFQEIHYTNAIAAEHESISNKQRARLFMTEILLICCICIKAQVGVRVSVNHTIISFLQASLIVVVVAFAFVFFFHSPYSFIYLCLALCLSISCSFVSVYFVFVYVHVYVRLCITTTMMMMIVVTVAFTCKHVFVAIRWSVNAWY